MPHRVGEKYLMEYIEDGCYTVYETLIQLSPLNFYMPEPEGPIDRNKKLLVIGLNGTMCDLPDVHENLEIETARPYLHVFLKEVFEYFNIFIWSTDYLDDLLNKVDILDIKDSNDYTISAYLDRSLMQKADSSHFRNSKIVKNLEVIYGQNNSFQLADIIMVDNNPWSILRNPENGILISPYKQCDFEDDDELLELAVYLKALVRAGHDFREIKHKNWKQVVDIRDAEN